MPYPALPDRRAGVDNIVASDIYTLPSGDLPEVAD